MNFLLALFLTPGAFFLSFQIRKKWLFPFLSVAAVYLPFLRQTRESAFDGFLVVCLWAVLQSALVLYFSFRDSARMDCLIWKGRRYSESMFAWIDSGKLPEGNVAAVIFFHLKQTLLYCALALLTANFLSLVLGCALLNYMNFYVARLALASRSRMRAFLMGWNPWSVIRVFAFLWLGVLLSLPLIAKSSFRFVPVLPGVIGVILDIVLKIFLSPYWSRKLRGNLSA